jgi:DNA-binding protein Fis
VAIDRPAVVRRQPAKGGAPAARGWTAGEAAGADGDQAPVALRLAALVPAVVEALAVARPGRVHREALALLERPLLAHTLALTRGNQLRAARLLGLNRNTVRRRCRELGLPTPASEARVRS